MFISYPFLILACLFLLGIIFLEPSPKERERARVETMIIGGDILNVLETYLSEHGRYPHALDVLVPKYMAKLKPPRWGDTEWLYTFNEKGFILKVGYEYNTDLYPVMIYESSQGYWYVNQ